MPCVQGRPRRRSSPRARGRNALAAQRVPDPSDDVKLDGTYVAVFSDSLADVEDNVELIRRQVLISGGIALVIAILAGYLVARAMFYGTLDIAFARVFTDRPERDILRRTARGFVSVAGLVGVIVALIVGGSLAAAAEAFLPNSSPALAALGRVLASVPAVTAIGVVVIAVVYRIVPPRNPSWSAIWLPAVVAGVGIVALSQLFLFVAPRLIGAALLAGSLATAFIALAWLSFTFQVLLLGAAWVRVRDDRAVAPESPSALAGAAAPAEPGGRGE